LLRVPLVDLAELHFLNLVARLDALDYLRQLFSSPFPFPTRRRAIETQLYKRYDYKGWAGAFTYLMILSVLAHKNLAPVHKWGKGKEEQGTRIILYSYRIYRIISNRMLTFNKP